MSLRQLKQYNTHNIITCNYTKILKERLNTYNKRPKPKVDKFEF